MSRIWEKPWNLDEFIANSENWTLAGDVALLNTLKSFADNLLKEGNEINENLENLTESLNEQSLKLNLAQNQFQRLRNSQFIESRVYEDEEEIPVEEKHEEQEVKEDQNQELKLAIEKGLDVIDRYFDKIDVEISDSEDEGDFPNYVLKPKDLYLHRPLPYVIGSEEWKKDHHVGLETSSESENEEENYSSGSDEPLTSTMSQIIKSESGSEDFNPYNDKLDEYKPPPIKDGANFAEQLAAKLGEINKEEINQRPILKTVPEFSGLFNEEPPPLEKKGLFSSGGLFDDDDEEEDNGEDVIDKAEELLTEKPAIPYLPPIGKHQPLLVEEPPLLEDLKSTIQKKVRRISSSEDEESEREREIVKQNRNLFDEDDEIFSKKSDLFDEDLFTTAPSVKSINNVNLFDSSPPPIENETKVLVDPPTANTLCLFDDEPPEDDFFDNITKNDQKKSNLFDDVFDSKNLAKFSLFDDVPPEDNLFDEVDEVKEAPTSIKRTSLVDEEPPPTDYLFDKIEKTTAINKGSMFDDELPEDQSVEKIKESPVMNKAPLFTEKPPDDDFLNNKTQKSSIFDDDDDYFVSKRNNEKEEVPKKLSLFDDVPPEDLFEDKEELFENEPITSLFKKEEEKKVDIKEKSKDESVNIVAQLTQKLTESPEIKSRTTGSSPGKLKMSLNINVGALIPGAAPPKLKAREEAATREESEETVEDNKTQTLEDKTEALQHINKGRARAPLNRRPSTRRGRQASLRHSKSDFTLHSEESETPKQVAEEKEETSTPVEEKNKEPSKLVEEETKSSLLVENEPQPVAKLFEDNEEIQESASTLLNSKLNPHSISLFGSTGGDLFEDIEETIPNFHVENKKNVSAKIDFEKLSEPPPLTKIEKNPKATSLFDDDYEEEKREGIFTSKTETEQVPAMGSSSFTAQSSVTKSPEVKKEKSIFEDEDDEEDLFFTKKTVAKPVKKSLFDDDDEDDEDIFGSSASSSILVKPSKTVQKKQVKTSTIKRLENIKPTEDDPLSDLFD